MTSETIHPRGHMTLQLLDDAGNVTATFAHHNQVLDGGRMLLLSLLKGDSVIGDYELILGNKEFDPMAEKPLDQPGVVPVKLTGKPTLKMVDKELTITFRGNVEQGQVVIGGGMVAISEKSGDKTRDLYNFAATPNQVEMADGQSVSVNFRLAME
ncbi:hypothetical protein ACJ5NV_13655 [Loktanella agnita]|uniref:hypothetical protein n=1 Tax=Loktanella agnita TaxID=287097 RepID=UPI0039879D9C